jgi:hypothetical protein
MYWLWIAMRFITPNLWILPYYLLTPLAARLAGNEKGGFTGSPGFSGSFGRGLNSGFGICMIAFLWTYLVVAHLGLVYQIFSRRGAWIRIILPLC